MSFVFAPLAATAVSAANTAAAASGASGASSQASAAGGLLGTLITFGPIVLIFVVFYFLLMRPQRKKDKETAKMRGNLQVGDEITTVGGITGRVVSLKEDSITIETGADRSKIRIKKWAVQSNDTVHDESE